MKKALWVMAMSLAMSGGMVWADEPENAAMKAEIEVLKARLARLEGQVSSDMRGGSSGIGGKTVAGLLELPSGLSGVQLSGYVDTSYSYNFAEPEAVTSDTTNAGATTTRTTRGRAFDTESNGFTPHVAKLVIEKPESDSSPIGFRTDLFFGDDAEVIHATGAGIASDQFDLEQAYVTAKAPLGAGVDFKVGKFVTLLGSEVIESPSNWNFSRSFLFLYSIPFTHAGALASYPLGEWGSVTGGVVNGWDNVDDNNKAKSLIGNITLTPHEGVSLALNGITGAEQNSNSRERRTVLDLVATWQAMDKLAFMANYDFGHDGAVAPTGYDSKEWSGLALYAKYDLTDKWSLAGRWEWFDDKDNFRSALTSAKTVTIGGTDTSFTPRDLNLTEWTLTSQWKLYEHLLARLEYRHDQASQTVFLHHGTFDNSQDTVSAEMVYHF